jgi:hypothetical protein
MSGSHGVRLAAGLLGLFVLQGTATAQQLTDCPPRPGGAPGAPPATISYQMFSDACFVDAFPGGSLPLVLYDDYAWRSFLALVWPAREGQRGQPDSSVPFGTSGRATVFETFKAEWEVFQENGEDPKGWNEYGGRNPCGLANLNFGDVVLAAFSKFDSVKQAAPSGALVARNRTYVRYSSAFNERHFQHILDGKFYLRKNLQNFVPVPPGAVRIKTAWIDMRGIERPERFYTRDAWLLDLTSDLPKCEKTAVGLVGLHIVAKTPTHPQWIWSTFEHVDNVQGPQSTPPLTFNMSDGRPMPDKNPVECPIDAAKKRHTCPLPPPIPYNVDRVTPIYTSGGFSTSRTNEKYRAVLAQQYPTAPWKNYQLVMTQWPLERNRPDLDGSPANTFPGAGSATTAFSNTTMETFLQTTISTGCLGCHNFAALDKGKSKRLDFIFALLTRAFPRDLDKLSIEQRDALGEIGKLLDMKNQQ